MKKIIIPIIAIIILGGLVYLMNQVSPTVPKSELELIKQAYLGDGSVSCTFIEAATEFWPEEKFSIDIKAGKIRMLSKDNGVQSNIIIKDGIAYLWDGSVGMKFSVYEEEMNDIPLFANLEDEAAFNQAVENYQIECEAVYIDDNAFDLPEDVDFEDWDTLPQGMEIDYDFEDFDQQGYEDIDWEELEDLELE